MRSKIAEQILTEQRQKPLFYRMTQSFFMKWYCFKLLGFKRYFKIKNF